MCKPRVRMVQAPQPATGPTTRLGEQGHRQAPNGAQRHACSSGHAPWWTLWLLWPLIELGKWAAPVVVDVLPSLSRLSVSLLPLLLIAIGVALLVRRRPKE